MESLSDNEINVFKFNKTRQMDSAVYENVVTRKHRRIIKSTKINKMLLPSRFRKILDLFVSLDFVVNKMIINREILYIERISAIMKEMNHDNFNAFTFGQILTVFPESYFYQFDTALISMPKMIKNRVKLVPNLSYRPDIDFSPRKSEKCFSVSQIKFRKDCMYERLLKVVKEKHDEFLIKIGNSSENCVGWHPEFDLENQIDDIHSTNLDNKLLSKINLSSKDSLSIFTEKSLICNNLFKIPKASLNSKQVHLKDEINFSEESEKLNVVKKKKIAPANFIKENQEHFQKQKLPFHLRVLFELFINLDKSVHDVYSKNDVCFLTRIASSVSMKCNFSDVHLARIIAVYPDAYLLKWERLVSINSLKLTKKIDIVIKPNLRNDGTRSALMSPDKGFLKFDFIRLKERRQKFLDKCIDLVHSSYRSFLLKKLIPLESIDDYINQKVWHHEFNIDFHVELVKPALLPMKPEATNEFKEMKSFSQMFTIMKQKNVFDGKSKSSINFPMKTSQQFTSVPQSLVDKVRENKIKRLLFNNEDIENEARCCVISQLKEIINAVENEFKSVQGESLMSTNLADTVCKILNIDERTFNDYMNVLIEIIPNWIEKLTRSNSYFYIKKSVYTSDVAMNKFNRLVTNEES